MAPGGAPGAGSLSGPKPQEPKFPTHTQTQKNTHARAPPHTHKHTHHTSAGAQTGAGRAPHKRGPPPPRSVREVLLCSPAKARCGTRPPRAQGAWHPARGCQQTQEGEGPLQGEGARAEGALQTRCHPSGHPGFQHRLVTEAPGPPPPPPGPPAREGRGGHRTRERSGRCGRPREPSEVEPGRGERWSRPATHWHTLGPP